MLSWVASLIFHKGRNYLVLGVFVKYFFFCDVIASWHFQSSSNLSQIQYLGNIGSVFQSPMFLGRLNNLITIALYKSESTLCNILCSHSSRPNNGQSIVHLQIYLHAEILQPPP